MSGFYWRLDQCFKFLSFVTTVVGKTFSFYVSVGLPSDDIAFSIQALLYSSLPLCARMQTLYCQRGCNVCIQQRHDLYDCASSKAVRPSHVHFSLGHGGRAGLLLSDV